MIPVHPDLARQRANGWLVAFDPGLLHPAVAVFDRGVLVGASRVRLPGSLKKEDDGERARVIAELTFAYVVERTRGAVPSTLVVERPKVYPVGRSEGDPADLIAITLVAGAVIGRLSGPGLAALAPIPSDWIGAIPKAKTGDPRKSPRGSLIMRRLTPSELALVELSHDAFDACGLGMHALGRLAKVYSAT